jgi:hypothetical protein
VVLENKREINGYEQNKQYTVVAFQRHREINSGGKNYDISVLLKDPKVCF